MEGGANMAARNNKLLLFNSMMLLNKREVLESFDDFVQHHRRQDNKEGYSEGKRKVLLALCDEFRKELEKCDIPTLTKPWIYYEYHITQDSLKLSLFRCDNIEFDEDDVASTMFFSEEYALVEVKCDYLTVEQYADIYGVTTTTVRQWIRRGKLRTARKEGRDWLIPALADKPKRGFESVIYHWDVIDDEVKEAFPFVADINCLSICQDDNDKKIFYVISGWPGEKDAMGFELSTKEREQLEIMLIASPGVEVEDVNTESRYVPVKQNFALPVLSYQDDDFLNRFFTFSDIIIFHHCPDAFHFSPDSEPRSSYSFDYTSTYIVPVNWTFWGVPHERDDILFSALEEGDYTECVQLGILAGRLILCEQMIADSYDPLIVCDDDSADMGYVMSELIDEGGPLNEITGEPLQNVLYIEELEIEDELQGQGIGSRILQELPSACLELLHVMPDILAYYAVNVEQDQTEESE
jgi:excisionase family DNA binding protein